MAAHLAAFSLVALSLVAHLETLLVALWWPRSYHHDPKHPVVSNGPWPWGTVKRVSVRLRDSG